MTAELNLLRLTGVSTALTLVLVAAAASAGATERSGAPDVVRLAQASPQKSATPAASGSGQKRAPAKSQDGDGAAAAPAAASGDAGLKKRVESLEEQLVDLQVTIGTLESLAKSGVGNASASAGGWRASGGGGSASDQARLDGIETQIRALTAQMEQLSAQVRQGGNGTAAAGRKSDVAGFRSPDQGGGFGSTTVTPNDGDADAIGGLIANDRAPSAGRQAAAATPPPPPVAGSDAGAKQLYETAYGHLLQQDYGAAETAFDDFLKRYPNDSLAGNAQYWLGESHYVRGQYKAAAGAFLKGYQAYGKSAKAPDSLLKLAMSLDRLGQKDAACSSYNELNVKFPNAPAHVKARAQSERQRIGCA